MPGKDLLEMDDDIGGPGVCYDPGSYVYFAVLYGFCLCCGSSQPEGGATTIGVSPGAGCRLVQGLEELL
jgi:hypothetical protein